MESFVLFPVRCISCLKVLGALQIKYENLLLNGFSPGEALDKLEVRRYCCRTNILTSERIILPPRKKPYGILSEGLKEQDELTSINKQVDDMSIVPSSSLNPNSLSLIQNNQKSSVKTEQNIFVGTTRNSQPLNPAINIPFIKPSYSPITISYRPVVKPLVQPFKMKEQLPSEEETIFTTIENRKMIDVELEYMQYALSEKIKDIFQTSLGDSQKYEAKNILERWILTLYNDLGPGPKSSPVFPVNSISTDATMKMINEIVEKKIRLNIESAKELVGVFLEKINNFRKIVGNYLAQISPQLISDNIIVSDQTIVYKDYKIMIYPRLLELLQKYGKEDLVRMLLRYEAAQMGSQHWGIPYEIYKYLYDNCGITNEAFSSPLNSRLIFSENSNFFTLFKDTDAIFGSKGDFLKSDLGLFSGGFFINPPFIDKIMISASKKVLQYLDQINGNKTILYTIVSWTDSEAYLLLKKSKWKRKEYPLKKKEHYFVSPQNEIIMANFDSTLFVLGQDCPEGFLEEILTFWKTIPK